jgi:hypothetical protein
MAMQVESKASAFFNIFNSDVTLISEGNDSTGPFTYAGDNPTNQLISADQDVTARITWNAGGLIPAMSKLDYTVTLYVDGAVADTKVVTGGPLGLSSPASYTADVIMPSGLSVGVHRLTVTLTVKVNGPGGLNLPVAGFQDLGSIQVYPA